MVRSSSNRHIGNRCLTYIVRLTRGHVTTRSKPILLCKALPGLAVATISLRRSVWLSVDVVTDDWAPDPDELTHVYIQVADHIAGLIASGALAPGAKLPAERDIAAQYNVSYETVRRATAVLRERGLIVTMIGRGTYIAKPGSRAGGVSSGPA